jgi:hypothetical protein
MTMISAVVGPERHIYHGSSSRLSNQVTTADRYAHRYFTLAHEIAHNLVQPHNSEHEFYFSALCEEYIYGLCKLLPSLET